MFKLREILSKNSEQIEYVSLLDELKIMTDSGIRWLHRFNNFKLALAQLNDAMFLSKERELSLLEKQGLIQAFEYTHELAWKVMKDFFEYQEPQFMVPEMPPGKPFKTD
jgi:hypothetical protein